MIEMSDPVSSKARTGVPSTRIEAKGLGGAGVIVGEGREWEESQKECVGLVGATNGAVVREWPVSLTTSSFPGLWWWVVRHG